MGKKNPRNAPAEVKIILVHGTWGRGVFPRLGELRMGKKPFWFEAMSPFRRALQSQLDVSTTTKSTIDTFLWSGANSIKVRYEAANELAVRLKTEITENPRRRLVLVGHSHGGSVLMLAARMVDQPERLEIVTLSTPFIEIVRENVSDMYSDAVRIASGALGIGVGAVLLAILLSTLANLHVLESFKRSVGPLIAIPYALTIALAGWGLYHLVGTKKQLLRKLHDLKEKTKGGMELANVSRALIIRSVDDEASLVLAAVAIGNRLSMRLNLLLILVLPTCIGILGLLFLTKVKPVLGLDWEYVARIFLFGGPVAFYSLNLLTGVLKSLFGRELCFHSLILQIKSHSVPDFVASQKSVTVSTLPAIEKGALGLRHAIYDHADVPQVIARWITTAEPNTS